MRRKKGFEFIVYMLLLNLTGCITANTSKKLDLVPDSITLDAGHYDDGFGGKFNVQGISVGITWSIAEPY